MLNRVRLQTDGISHFSAFTFITNGHGLCPGLEGSAAGDYKTDQNITGTHRVIASKRFFKKTIPDPGGILLNLLPSGMTPRRGASFLRL